MNLYTYGLNNPVKYTDPSGNCVWDLCVVEASGVIWTIGAVAATITAALGTSKALNDSGNNIFQGSSSGTTSANDYVTPKSKEEATKIAATLTAALTAAKTVEEYKKNRKNTTVYLWSNVTSNNVTPRYTDVQNCSVNVHCGLSMSLEKPKSGPYTVFYLEDLLVSGFIAYNDHDKHITVKPMPIGNKTSNELLNEWASTRNGVGMTEFNTGAYDSQYTTILKALAIKSGKVKK